MDHALVPNQRGFGAASTPRPQVTFQGPLKCDFGKRAGFGTCSAGRKNAAPSAGCRVRVYAPKRQYILRQRLDFDKGGAKDSPEHRLVHGGESWLVPTSAFGL